MNKQQERIFGTTDAGETVTAYTLTDGKYRAEALDFGATLRSLVVPYRGGELDVLLGYDSVAEYQHNSGYFGAAVGRFGNRIANGRITVAGKEYQLYCNNGPHHLHGGKVGYSKKMWKAERLADNAVRFSLVSPDGDENYPGTLNVSVTYRLEDGRIRLLYEAETDKETVMNLTNHSYFNLNGAGSGTMLAHTLRLDASRFVPIDPKAIPLGGFRSVEGTPFDFRKGKRVGDEIDADDEQIRAGQGYDHHFAFDAPAGTLRKVGSVTGDKTGVRMDLWTDRDGVQFYAGNFITEVAGKNGTVYHKRDGLCLETQTAPDAPNHPELGSAALLPGTVWRSETDYAFTVPSK